MALFSRYKTAVGAGTTAAFLLVAIFGSPWYRHWATHNTNENTAGGWFLRLLGWPAWAIDKEDTIKDVFATAIRAILVVVFTALFLYMLPGTQLARARGTFSQLFAGWAAYIFAAALAAMITTLFR